MTKKEMRGSLLILAESKDGETARKARAAIKCLDDGDENRARALTGDVMFAAIAKIHAIDVRLAARGERKPEYVPQLSADQQRIFDNLDRKSGPVRASMTGTRFTTPFMTPEQARKRLADLEKETV